MLKFLRFHLFVLLLALLLSGCSRDPDSVIPETDERAFRRGNSLLREGRPQEALAAFLSVTESRRDAPESHLRAGLIYLQTINDPIAAIFHFRKFLEFRPAGENSDFVRELIDTARKEFARTLPGQPFGEQVDRLDLLERLERVQRENAQLHQQVANLNARLQATQQQTAAATSTTPVAPTRTSPQSPTAPTQAASAPQPARTAPATYVVQAGDTLSRISQQVYGTPNRWREIFEANRDTMASPNSLRVGQELRIP